jgi:dihydrofolate reductase
MSFVTSHMSISLDGFVAGPDQSQQNPLGVGGLRLHDWHIREDVHTADQAMVDRLLGPRGAYVMGRNMFGPIRGEWQGDWRGWWGDDPPYHAPVFVLTHHPHDPIQMSGGTTFFFVEGFDAAMEQARAAAGDEPIDIAGGASTVRQALRSAVLDELLLDIVPVLLGQGERLFDDVGNPELAPVEVVHSPHVTHVRYELGGSDANASR